LYNSEKEIGIGLKCLFFLFFLLFSLCMLVISDVSRFQYLTFVFGSDIYLCVCVCDLKISCFISLYLLPDHSFISQMSINEERFRYCTLHLWLYACKCFSFMTMCEVLLIVVCTFRKEGQDTQDELQKRNLREELEDRERRHFSSKDKYIGKKKEKEDEEEEYLTSLLLSCNLLF
jgi:hypothetical protein